MEKTEFMQLLFPNNRNWSNFYIFAGTQNLEKGECMYHWCKFCSHITKQARSDTLDKINKQIAEHLWKEHRSDVTRMALEIKAREIASKRGQMKLEI